MTQLADEPKTLTTHAAHHGGPGWFSELKSAAHTRFAEVGFPSATDEEWRFTAIDTIARTRYTPATPATSAKSAELVKLAGFGHDVLTELVFVNGRYVPQLSRLGKLPGGAIVQPLSEAINAGTAEADLGTVADVQTNPFVAYNTAGLHDGVFIHVPRGVTVDGTIHLLFVTTAEGAATVTHPRVLLVADENAEATLVETYVGDGAYLTNAVTEFVVAADARIDHCKLQQESTAAFHVATVAASLARSAKFVSHSISIGAAICRNDVNVALNGEYADATINGLVLIDANQLCDNHTLLDHAAANCPSHELYKHVLGGQSRGVFKGKILVRPDSQKTDSKQTSKTLLLSDEARMNAMPALEIYADDVKCTHGSTTGPVDEEQVFYLRSRGVSHEASRHLLTYAFAADITRRIKVAPVRARVENHMAAQHGLPLDLRITDLGGHDEAVVNG